MENVEHHHHQAFTRLSLSPPPPPPPRSAPLSPNSAAAEANARWTPTKEQIGVLEGLYRQGMRTPTSEQIRQVTERLREHGPIEGKNVFYWFQNHKARQRQKQKQQTFEYFSRQFHRPQPLPILHRAPGHPYPGTAPHPQPSQMMMQAPPQHSACNTQVMYRQQLQQHQQLQQQHQQLQLQQHQQLQLQQQHQQQQQAAAHAAYYQQTQVPSGTFYYQHPAPTNAGTQQQPRVLHYPPVIGGHAAANARPVKPQTLNLFPLHPTFAQREKTQRPGTAGSTRPSTSKSRSWESEISEGHNGEASVPPFYDFFGISPGGH
ncbi:unnamed protein product [Alopecurus aequalis]